MSDKMTREEMLQEADLNRGNLYTTDELFEDELNYVYIARSGYVFWANGEEVMDEDEELPKDGWYECTGFDEEMMDDSNNGYNPNYDSSLYDEEDW